MADESRRWVVFGHVLKIHGPGWLYRSGTITITVRGETANKAKAQAEAIIAHFVAEDAFPHEEVTLTIMDFGNRDAQKKG